jgi:hypothetical protein
VRRLYDAEASGWAPSALLRLAADKRELGTADSVAEVMSWRIDTIVKETPTPPVTGASLETAAAAKARLERTAAMILGPDYAKRAQSETAWPALIAALHRAENDGQDPVSLLTLATAARELRTARSVSETLAWRVSRRLAARRAPGGEGTEREETARGVREENALPWVARAPAGPGEPGTMSASSRTSSCVQARMSCDPPRGYDGQGWQGGTFTGNLLRSHQGR